MPDADPVRLRIISLGAGVQSTTMALMAAHGELPMPDCAIFADTGWEPKAVYEHLRWLLSSNVLPFPVHVVNAGNIRQHIVDRQSPRAQRFAAVPWHITGHTGKRGIGRRQCTSHYKLEPMRKKERELLGKGPRDHIPGGTIEKWLGISVDEIFRATPSKVKFETNRFPLIEQRMHRSDCLLWLERHDYPRPPKSSCIGCPFHSNPYWRELKKNAPDEFADAVAIDEMIRNGDAWHIKGLQYMHFSHKPLSEVDLSTAEDHGQINLFNNECDGMCGV